MPPSMHCPGKSFATAGLALFALAGACFAKQTPQPKAADKVQWVQSYDAGYLDDKGAYAGGSEIMHLVSHKGKLYAANGYWLDARWVIPPDAEKQSAQVLRLDAANERWQIDLDMGKSNGLGLQYMKGNILKSVTFTRDAAGKRLTKSQNLLVMAAGANFEHRQSVLPDLARLNLSPQAQFTTVTVLRADGQSLADSMD